MSISWNNGNKLESLKGIYLDFNVNKSVFSLDLISNDGFDFVFEAFQTFIDSSSVRFDTVEDQIVLPAAINLVQTILKENM